MSLSAGLVMCLLIITSIGVVAALFNKETNLTVVIIDHRDQAELEDKEFIEEINMEEVQNDTHYLLLDDDDTKEAIVPIQYDTSEVSEEVKQALGLFLKDISGSDPIEEKINADVVDSAEKNRTNFEAPLPEPPPVTENRLDILYADRHIEVDEHYESQLQTIDQLAGTIDPAPEPSNELETLLGFVQYNLKNQKTEMTIYGTNSVITLIGMDGSKGKFIIEGSYIQPGLFGVESFDLQEVDVAEVV